MNSETAVEGVRSQHAILSDLPHVTTLVEQRGDGPVKLHLGCGGVRWLDFLNVDLFAYDEEVPDTSRSGCVADGVGDMRSLGLPNDSVDEIFTSHTLEHFTRWEATDMLADWLRMLRPGGKLVMETPDFARCVLWLFHPSAKKRRVARNMFYGNQWNRIDFETHRYVWSARELRRELTEIGFDRVRTTHRTWTHYRGRDMRATAYKPRAGEKSN